MHSATLTCAISEHSRMLLRGGSTTCSEQFGSPNHTALYCSYPHLPMIQLSSNERHNITHRMVLLLDQYSPQRSAIPSSIQYMKSFIINFALFWKFLHHAKGVSADAVLNILDTLHYRLGRCVRQIARNDRRLLTVRMRTQPGFACDVDWASSRLSKAQEHVLVSSDSRRHSTHLTSCRTLKYVRSNAPENDLSIVRIASLLRVFSFL